MWLDWTPRGRVLVSAKRNGMGKIWQMRATGKERSKAALPNNMGGGSGIREIDALHTGLLGTGESGNGG